MKLKLLALGALSAVMVAGMFSAPAAAQPAKPWYKSDWDPARAKPCDRACLVGFMDQYLRAMETRSPAGLPLAEEIWFTENTARMDLGEGVLWRADLKPTAFRITAADPVTGEVAVQTVYSVQGKPAMVAIRLKIDRRMITEVEELLDRDVAPEAMELLTTPRPSMVDDLPVKDRSTREYMIYAANAYFDALTGENGKIAPFADECIRHEQGYQTVNNKTPGRAAPSPVLPDPKTPMGSIFSRLSTMTCEQQISTRIFNGVKKIWPRRALVIDEQKGLVATFPLFVHDGTKRHVEPTDFASNDGVGMILNMVTMETFAVRKDKIQDVEAFPFVTFQYGLGDGWTPGKGR